MNVSFMNQMLDRCRFPEEAKVFFNDLADRVTKEGHEEEFLFINDFYFSSGLDTGKTEDRLEVLSAKMGVSVYSMWMLHLLIAAERAKPLYDKRGVSDEVFFDTFSDLRAKALECMEEYGIWGTFVAGWYGLFYSCRIIKFGRLEYEDGEYYRENPSTYVCGDISVPCGTPMKGIHIPSSGEPFDLEARLESYRMAYEFYTKETGLDYLVCDCGSWLIYEPYEKLLPEKSNIRSFMHDFDIIKNKDEENFHDNWRLFGKYHRLPVEEYPEDTAMRRAFKKYLLEGNTVGEGIGMLIFDGEKILTERR